MEIKLKQVRYPKDLNEYTSIQKEITLRGREIQHYEKRVAKRVHYMVKMLSVNKITPTSVLFVGCRDGLEIMEFRKFFPAVDVTGLDLVQEFVDSVVDGGEDGVCADAHNLPFDDDEYDIVFSAQTLEHCYDPPMVIKEFTRVAKKAIYLSLPLEDHEHCSVNPSHCVYAQNPLAWLSLFTPYPLWRLQWGMITETNTFDMLMMYLGQEFESEHPKWFVEQ